MFLCTRIRTYQKLEQLKIGVFPCLRIRMRKHIRVVYDIFLYFQLFQFLSCTDTYTHTRKHSLRPSLT